MTETMADDDSYLVVVNAEGQHALWPSPGPAVPAGWSTVSGPAGQRDCLAYVEANWPDIRPRSLVEATSRGGR